MSDVLGCTKYDGSISRISFSCGRESCLTVTPYSSELLLFSCNSYTPDNIYFLGY